MNPTAYLEHWKLTKKPFQNTPDPEFFYKSEQHQEALSRLLVTVLEQYGAAMLTGTYGCGKTALIQVLLAELKEKRCQTALISNPPQTYPALLRGIVRQLRGGEGLPAEATDQTIDFFLERLEDILKNNSRDRTETLIIIDEAHTLTNPQTLDGLRRLLNFQQADQFLLTLILVGQPELEQIIANLKPLAQRIAMTARLDAMTSNDTKGYLWHRLQQAGAEKNMFSDAAVTLLHQRSGGIPRRLNHLAELSLLLGAHQELQTIEPAFIKGEVFDQEEAGTR